MRKCLIPIAMSLLLLVCGAFADTKHDGDPVYTPDAAFTNWVSTNTWGSQIAALEHQTSKWNQASVNAIWATNWISTNALSYRVSMLEGRSNVWNQASVNASYATNWISTNSLTHYTDANVTNVMAQGLAEDLRLGAAGSGFFVANSTSVHVNPSSGAITDFIVDGDDQRNLIFVDVGSERIWFAASSLCPSNGLYTPTFGTALDRWSQGWFSTVDVVNISAAYAWVTNLYVTNIVCKSIDIEGSSLTLDGVLVIYTNTLGKIIVSTDYIWATNLFTTNIYCESIDIGGSSLTMNGTRIIYTNALGKSVVSADEVNANTGSYYIGWNLWCSYDSDTTQVVSHIPMVYTTGGGTTVQYITIADLFAGVGTTGLVTSSAGDAGKFLKADGTWSTTVTAESDPYLFSWLGSNTYAKTSQYNNFLSSNKMSGDLIFPSSQKIRLGAGKGQIDFQFTMFRDGNLYPSFDWVNKKGYAPTNDFPTESLDYGLGVLHNDSGAFDMWTVDGIADSGNEIMSYIATTNWVIQRGYLTGESDPFLFSWLGSNTYVKTEADPKWTVESNQYVNVNQKAAAGGVATLDGDAKIPYSQVPAIAITDTWQVNETNQISAVTNALLGDVLVVLDLAGGGSNAATYIATNELLPSSVATWVELTTPTDEVRSVNGKFGTVTLFATDLPDFQSEVSNNTLVAGAVQNESDPFLFSWLGSNTYVKAESDPFLFSWLGSNTYVKAESDPFLFSWLGSNTYIKTESDPFLFNWLGTNAYIETGDVNWSLGSGTFTGKVYSTIDHTVYLPEDTELPTAAWVRSLAIQGQAWYYTTTITNFLGAKTTNFVVLSTTPVNDAFTNSFPSPLPSNTYLASGVITSMVTAVRSPITFEMYLNRVGGNASSILPVHPEIYYIYNGTTNHLGDYDTADRLVTTTTPSLYQFTVSFEEPTITGLVYVVAYLKSGTVSGTAAGLNIVGGGVYDSKMDVGLTLEGQSASEVQANLTTHTNATGTAVHGLGTMSTAASNDYWTASVIGGKNYMTNNVPNPTFGASITVVQDATNSLAFQWWAASNRWAAVSVIGTKTNVAFVSPQ